jgi:hypothetical protein
MVFVHAIFLQTTASADYLRGTNHSLFSFFQQRKQQDNAAEMGYRFPKRTGRRAEPLF